MQNLSKKIFPALVTVSLFLAACKKNNDTLAPKPPADTVRTPVSTANPQLIKDSVLIYSKDIYLWNTQIPATFNPQAYTDPPAVMTAIRAYSMEPGFSGAVDRWSFAIKKTEWDQMSAGMGSIKSPSTEGDFGFSVFFNVEGDLRVRLVEPNAPAGLAGIHRSWRITAINGNTNMTTSNADFIVNAVYYGTTGSFTFLKPDGNTVSINLNAAHYTEKPVYLDTVYNIGGKKIGYLVFNSFLGKVADISAEFQRVFNHFASEQVTNVVVDLRYNGGGFVSLAEQLGNYLVNSSANGGLMMKQIYNSQNSPNNETTNFKKAGSVNLNEISFIVGRGTASASELLINNLKPYLTVKLIGPTPTHGKPVGFFPIPVGEWYIFPVSFRTTNKNGEGNYFNGMPVNAQVRDGLDKDWGDVNEADLASAIKNITTGNYLQANTESFARESAGVSLGNKKLDAPALKITVDTRKNF